MAGVGTRWSLGASVVEFAAEGIRCGDLAVPWAALREVVVQRQTHAAWQPFAVVIVTIAISLLFGTFSDEPFAAVSAPVAVWWTFFELYDPTHTYDVRLVTQDGTVVLGHTRDLSQAEALRTAIESPATWKSLGKPSAMRRIDHLMVVPPKPH